jgi:integrase
MARIELTDKKVQSLKVTGTIKDKKDDTGKPLPRQRQDFMDSVVPRFGVRVTDKGVKTYILAGRFPGSKFYTRRELGEVGELTLAAARDKAREWIALILQGKDPKLEEARVKREQAAKRENTFSSVADKFVEWCRGPDETRPRQRRWKEVKRQTAILADQWGSRPVTDIERDEIVAIIKDKARIAPAETRNLLTVTKSLFSWAREQNFGLRHNVAADIKPSRVIGEKVARDRVLDEHELRRLWAAVGGLGYPTAEVYRLLILSGSRLNEVAQATWSEIDLDRRLWVIPASRMKGRNGKVQNHTVPLTVKMVEILNAVPRFKSGPFVFSASFGVKPVSIGSQVKRALDAELRFEPWINHDIRRSVRSGLAALGVDDATAEAVLAHVQPGIRAVYNRHDYLKERLDALTRWGEFIDPPAPREGSRVASLSEHRRAARA